MTTPGGDIATLIAEHDAVLSTCDVLRVLTRDQLRWKLASGRWQQPACGVVIAHSGPPTGAQMLRATQLRMGPQSALAGLTAAGLDGLTGFGDNAPLAGRPVHVLGGWPANRSP